MSPAPSVLAIPKESIYLEEPPVQQPAAETLSPKILIALGALYLMHLVLMLKRPLIGDEAYYWLWGKHLAWGYHDHPPLIGWMIALSTLFSNQVFWVRFPALACSLLGAVFFYDFVKDISGSSKQAGLAVLLFSCIPILAISLITVLPDTPLNLAWILCLWAAWKSLKRPGYWPLAGLSLGAALLSKLMAFFLLGSLVLFFIINRDARAKLKGKLFWIGAAAAGLVSAPFWIWNSLHGWDNIAFQMRDHLGNPPAHPLFEFLGFLGIQALSVSPILFVLFIAAAGALFKKSIQGDQASQYLAALAFPILFYFLGLTFWDKVGFHWLIPGYLALLAGFTLLPPAPALKKWTRRGLVTALSMTFFFYAVCVFPQAVIRALLPVDRAFPKIGIVPFLQGKGFGEILGYQGLSGLVEQKCQAMEQGNPVFLLTDSFTLSSDFIYYTGRKTCTLLLSGEGGEYARWNHFQEQRGKNAVWVNFLPLSETPAIQETLSRAFQRIGEPEKLEVEDGGITRTFYLERLYDLHDPIPLEAPPQNS